MNELQLLWARQALSDTENMPAYLYENILKEITRLETQNGPKAEDCE